MLYSRHSEKKPSIVLSDRQRIIFFVLVVASRKIHQLSFLFEPHCNPAFHLGCFIPPPPTSFTFFILSCFRRPRSYPAHKHGRKIINCRIAYEKYAHPLAIPPNTFSSIVSCLVSGGMILEKRNFRYVISL